VVPVFPNSKFSPESPPTFAGNATARPYPHKHIGPDATLKKNHTTQPSSKTLRDGNNQSG
jgi:hypothetical protein